MAASAHPARRASQPQAQQHTPASPMNPRQSTEPASPIPTGRIRAGGRRMRSLAALALGLVLTLLALEVLLRFLPVNRGFAVAAVQPDQPVLHFRPNRDFTWSKGPLFALATEIPTNNAGFRNDRDYLPPPPSPSRCSPWSATATWWRPWCPSPRR